MLVSLPFLSYRLLSKIAAFWPYHFKDQNLVQKEHLDIECILTK